MNSIATLVLVHRRISCKTASPFYHIVVSGCFKNQIVTWLYNYHIISIFATITPLLYLKKSSLITVLADLVIDYSPLLLLTRRGWPLWPVSDSRTSHDFKPWTTCVLFAPLRQCLARSGTWLDRNDMWPAQRPVFFQHQQRQKNMTDKILSSMRTWAGFACVCFFFWQVALIKGHTHTHTVSRACPVHCIGWLRRRHIWLALGDIVRAASRRLDSSAAHNGRKRGKQEGSRVRSIITLFVMYYYSCLDLH